MRSWVQIYSKLASFWVLCLPLFLLVFLLFIGSAPKGFEPLSYFYFYLISIAEAAFLSWFLLVFLPFVLYFISFKRLPVLGISTILAFAVLFLLALDYVIYLQFHLHLQWVFLQMILSPARSHIYKLTSSDLSLIILVILGLILLESIFYYLIKRKTINLNLLAYLQLSFMAIGISAQAIHIWADAIYEPRLLVATELVPGFYGITAKRFLAKHHILTASDRPPNLASFANTSLSYPLHPLKLAKEFSNKNILIIAIDSWRADSMNSTITPNIFAFAKTSTMYKNHFSGGNSTRAGIFSLFYSINPQLFDTVYREGTRPLIFSILRKRNYLIKAFTSASAESPPFHRTVFHKLSGFTATLPGIDAVERDKEVTSNLISSIDSALQKEQKFFVFGFYDSAHAYQFPPAPFYPPFKPYKKVSHTNISMPGQGFLMHNQYNNALYFIDGLIQEVIGHLIAKSALNDTVVIITGDHGEEFNDNNQGFWGHNSNFTPAQTQVPLVVFWADSSKNTEINYLTSHYDVIPSLFQKILGVENPIKDYSIGRLLSDPNNHEPILIGSYNKLAILSLQKKRLLVANSLGYFQMQNLGGEILKEPIDGGLVAKAYSKMQHFSRSLS